MARFAIYFAPAPDNALWRFGSGVIGYDAASGADVSYLLPAGQTEGAWAALTAEPRRYGFHATLKAPFELAPGVSPDALLGAAERLAASLAGIRIARLQVSEIGRFIALVPSEPSPALLAIADECVTRLDHLRAPLSDKDRARRLQSTLTVHQIALLDRYGYPYVLDEFRFHMTLTGPIAHAPLRGSVRSALTTLYAEKVPPGALAIDRLAVFHQPEWDQRFQILATFPLNRPRGA